MNNNINSALNLLQEAVSTKNADDQAQRALEIYKAEAAKMNGRIDAIGGSKSFEAHTLSAEVLDLQSLRNDLRYFGADDSVFESDKF